MQGTSKSLPSNARNEIVNLFNAGLGLSDIPRNTRVPKGARAVHNMNRPTLFSPLDDSTIFLFSCGG